MPCITESAHRPAKLQESSDGRLRYRVRILEGPRWGSSGYYSREALDIAATEQVFHHGTKVYLDHPKKSDESDRPERTLRDLTGILEGETTREPDGLWGTLLVKPHMESIVRSLAADGDLDMSIRAYATSFPGDADGRRGHIISHITEALSVDLVTDAGAGGRVVELIESARKDPAHVLTEATSDDRRTQLRRALTDLYSDPEHTRYVWLRDYDETAGRVWFEQDDHTWQQSFTVADDDLTVELVGNPTEVQPVTRYLPVSTGDDLTNTESATAGEGAPNMPTITEAELSAYKAAEGNVAALTAESLAATQEREKAVTERDEALAKLAEARKATAEALIGASGLPDAAKDRVRAAFEADTNADVAALITKEADYIKSVAPGVKITGFGATEAATSRRTRDAWGDPIKEK